MSRYLVTGASGFLGAHMAERLAKAGHEVFCPCHKTAFARPVGIRSFSGSMDNVAQWGQHLPPKLDAVLHFAALVPPQGSAVQYMDVNATGTARLLELCKVKGCPRVLLASTLYLADQTGPIPDDAPLASHHPYYISKFAAERLCAAYTHETGAKHVNFRISSPYGENMSSRAIIYIFMQQALTEHSIRVFNRGEKLQNFIYYQDIIDVFELALSIGSGTYNLCSRQSITIKDIAVLISEIVGTKVSVLHSHNSINDDHVRHMPLTDKIQSELGFKERYDMYTGCDNTLNFIKQKIGYSCGKSS